MAVTLDQVSEQILNNLKVLDPELDTSVGTPARKIIDSVAYAISQAYVDNHVISYTYDIDTKTAGDLDQFTQLFGIARLTEKRSTGKVTFTRSVGTTIVDIPFGTQVATAGGAVIFQTTGAVRMAVGELTKKRLFNAFWAAVLETLALMKLHLSHHLFLLELVSAIRQQFRMVQMLNLIANYVLAGKQPFFVL